MIVPASDYFAFFAGIPAPVWPAFDAVTLPADDDDSWAAIDPEAAGSLN